MSTWFITGCSTGLGRAFAEAALKAGHNVVATARDVTKVQDLAAAYPDSALALSLDVTDDEQVSAAVSTSALRFGSIDVLVNNAGYAWYGPTAKLDAAGFDALFATNVRAAYLMVAAFAPAMAERKRGSIVNIGSVLGVITTPQSAAYGATKAAIASLTRSWAAELAPSGVRVNNVAPGPIEADGAKGERTAALGKSTLLGRAATNAEIAEAVAFLASPKASYITGTTLLAHGGRSAI
jgi:NAD(P)-dependent dehydrogenase (short-subunit alcohol dehydrogenase family)